MAKASSSRKPASPKKAGGATAARPARAGTGGRGTLARSSGRGAAVAKGKPAAGAAAAGKSRNGAAVRMVDRGGGGRHSAGGNDKSDKNSKNDKTGRRAPEQDRRRDDRRDRAERPVRPVGSAGSSSASSSSAANPRPEVTNAVPTDQAPRKNQAGLSPKDLQVFRDLLLAKRREVVGDMADMEREALRSSGGTNLSTLPLHMADMGTDNYEQEFTLGLVEKDRQLLREINAALARIQNGSYGMCEGTGKPIPKARLEVQPWTRYSVEYARQQEMKRTGR